MLILAIDTSCDETSAAVTWENFILSNVISSQVELHKKYGGVVPMLAQRAHKERIEAVIEEAMKRADVTIKKYFHRHPELDSGSRKKNKKQKNFQSLNVSFSFLDSRLRGNDRRGSGNDNNVVLRPASTQRGEQAQDDKLRLKDIDIFAVTYGPGLAPALEVGIAKAKELALTYKKPLVAVDHMEGHVYANFAKKIGAISNFPSAAKAMACKQFLISKQSPVSNIQYPNNKLPNYQLLNYRFPLLCLLISGGHTELVLMRDHGKYEIIGETLDDAVGEAFDKVAKMLNLGYPGGPIVELLAKEGDPQKYLFPVPLEKTKDCNFSYSGLKTSVFYTLKKISPKNKFTRKQICDICASFQRVAVEHLVQKTILVIKKYFVRHPELNSGSRNKKQRKKDLNSFSFLDSGSRSGMTKVGTLLLGGGVVANQMVRRELRKAMKRYNIQLVYPTDKKLWGDNAAMIAATAYNKTLRKQFVKNIPQLERVPSLRLH